LLFEEVSEPGPDLFGAAMLRAPPDLGQIIAVTIMRSMLHSAISRLEKLVCGYEREREAA
jgi:hypothetical protein